MFEIDDALHAALAVGRRELHDAQLALARANSGTAPGRAADAAMAQTAQAAIFSEALLSAEHARFAEMKQVAK